MSKADNDTLNKLHGVLAQVLMDEITATADEGKGRAAILNVARQFLKDNGIEALPGASKPLRELAAVLPFPESGEEEYKQA
jgi:hypothetical protein